MTETLREALARDIDTIAPAYRAEAATLLRTLASLISTTPEALESLYSGEAAIVPVEPTVEMETAGTEMWLCESAMEDRAAASYRAMLKAAQDGGTK